mgnify:CR=1 FL=1
MFATIWPYIELGVILLVSIGIHEFAHAYSSYKLGDPTPKIQWRLTPNPLKHIDPIGFIMVFLIHFWWWKPVQIDPSYYKHPYRDELISALAWPASNILLWVIALVILYLYWALFWIELTTLLTQDLVGDFWITFSILNFWLAVFNLIPIAPLDGYRLVKIFSHKAWERMEKYVGYISLFFLLIFVFGPLSTYVSSFISTVSYWLFRFFSFPLLQVFY